VHAVSVVVLVGVPDAGRHRAALKSPDYLCRWPKSLCLPLVALGEARAGICAGTLAQTLDGRVLARSGAMCVPPTLKTFPKHTETFANNGIFQTLQGGYVRRRLRTACCQSDALGHALLTPVCSNRSFW
jgi:hypothetical protein